MSWAAAYSVLWPKAHHLPLPQIGGCLHRLHALQEPDPAAALSSETPTGLFNFLQLP